MYVYSGRVEYIVVVPVQAQVLRNIHLETQFNTVMIIFSKCLTRKSSGGHQAKKKKGGKKNLSPRDRKAGHSTSTALLKSVAEIRPQSAMKSSRKTLHEFTSHIPQNNDHMSYNNLFIPYPYSHKYNLFTKEVVESTSKEEKESGREAYQALGAGKQATKVAPPSRKATRR
jgi:hypothetical protein